MRTGESLERARTLLRLSRPADAERELRGVLATEPEQEMAHCLLALALISQGRAEEAAEEAREAVRLAPEHWYPHYVAGQVHLRSGRPDEAVRAAEAALAHAPEESAGWELLARAHAGAARWRPMAEAARGGLAVDPENADLAALASTAHTGLGETGLARQAAGYALRLDPESANAHLASGRAALAAGEPRAAAEHFREVLRLDPGFDPARELLVAALKQRNPLQRRLSRLRQGYRGGWRLLFLLPVAPPLIAVFALIALLHWLAWVGEAVTVLRLARARATRLLFEGAEARIAVACCALLAAGVAVLALGAALGSPALAVTGATVMALVTPVQEAAHTGSPNGRATLYLWAGLLAVAAVVGAVSGLPPVVLLTLYAALGTIWIAAWVRRATAPRAASRAASRAG
ncbi:tetratricopeptide repeat protein [Actinomadura sp. ATCC 31491]|uniref:Tetratricopeptide repeat protein n=1 Tax=Actinomadura luzonensis TaxID=2805427 RepID=A0ABT0FNE7_9ACTN|nr:tetratricopeptide repeat protein [Actinomadura luzonensis]MCK2213827.1 tetratricopeptide repeat protein [Actinomadura luzonensis]